MKKKRLLVLVLPFVDIITRLETAFTPLRLLIRANYPTGLTTFPFKSRTMEASSQ